MIILPSILCLFIQVNLFFSFLISENIFSFVFTQQAIIFIDTDIIMCFSYFPFIKSNRQWPRGEFNAALNFSPLARHIECVFVLYNPIIGQL